MMLVLASAFILRSESSQDSWGGPVIPLGAGLLFVASYDSQGYDEGIRPRLHTGFLKSSTCRFSVYNVGTDHIENTALNCSVF